MDITRKERHGVSFYFRRRAGTRGKRIAALLFSVLILFQAGCAQTQQGSSETVEADPKPGSQSHQPAQTPFRLALYPGESLNPLFGDNRANLTLAPLLYEGLFTLDNQFRATPSLCTCYEAQEDYRRWTFTLRQGVTFSDGTPLTGATVAAALELARSPQSRYATRLEDISEIAPQEDAVTITLKSPNANLPVLLNVPIVLGEGTRPLGTGPYVLTAQALVARADWTGSLPLEEIALQEMRKSEEMIFAFDAGDISLVDVDMMGTNALGYSGNYELWSYPTTSLIYLGFQTNTGPCKSEQLRRAVSLAVDRETIAQTLYARHAVASALPVHPNSDLYDPDMAQELAFQPQQAALAVEEAGMQGKTLTLLVNNENNARLSAAQFIADQLQNMGLEVVVNQLPFEQYLAALKAGEFDLYIGEVMLGADFDLSALLAPFGALNYGRWHDWQIPAMLQSVRAAGEQERPAAAAELLTRLSQQTPIAPICFKQGAVLTKWGRLSGLAPVRGNPFAQIELWQVQS